MTTTASPPPELVLRDVTLRVPGRTLVRQLNLELRAGELWTIVGPNGAGKTTLLRVLAGLTAPSAGQALLDGRPLTSWRPRARARALAFLPQQTPLMHDLRTHEVVMLGRAPYLGAFRGPSPDDHRAVDEAITAMGLEGLRDRRVATLSGGERQRVMLARMLATGARVMVLDEPTTALDIGHALDLLERLRALARSGIGLVVAMHELELARRYGDRSLCLRADGHHDIGVTTQVLTPTLLERTFGVEVGLGEGLRFEPRRPGGGGSVDGDPPPP